MPKCLRRSVPNVRVRSANRADIPAMIELNHRSPTAAHWSVQQYESLFPEISSDGVSPARAAELDAQLSQRGILVVEDVPGTLAGTASGRHRIVAFLVTRRVENDWELENIVVADE